MLWLYKLQYMLFKTHFIWKQVCQSVPLVVVHDQFQMVTRAKGSHLNQANGPRTICRLGEKFGQLVGGIIEKGLIELHFRIFHIDSKRINISFHQVLEEMRTKRWLRNHEVTISGNFH